MEGLKNVLLSVDVVDRDLFYQLLKEYGADKIKDAFSDIVSVKKSFADNKERYDYQVYLWDRYGECFSRLNYYPFYEEILHNMKVSSFESKDSKYEKFSLEDEVTYGFRLLSKNYFSYFGKDNYIDIDSFYKPLSDRDKMCVIDLFMDYYNKYEPRSNFDKSFVSFLKEEKERIGNIKKYNNNILAMDLKLYFDYREAVYKFTSCNLGLVGKAASGYFDENFNFSDDHFQDGYLGLVRACDSYDIRYGYKFSTYSLYWINQFINRNIKNTFGVVRIPVYIIEKYNKIQRAMLEFFTCNGRKPSKEEISLLVDMSVDSINYVVSEFKKFRCDSLQKSVTDDEDGGRTLEDIVDDSSSYFEDNVVNRMDYDNVLDVIKDILSEREMDIIRLRYGLDSGRPMTLEEVGNMYNLTRERIRQIEVKSLRKLRHSYRVMNYSDIVQNYDV